MAKQILTFGLSMLLARLLIPADYGLVGIASVYIMFLSAVQDLGIGQSVIYFPDAEKALSTYCTVSAGAGLLLAAVMFASGPMLAAIYNSAALVPIVRWLSLTLILSGLRSVPQAIITKHLQFGKIALIETASTMLGATIAVYLACCGFGVWSLVANLVLSSSLNTALILAARPPRFTIRPDLRLCKEIIRWASPLTGSTLLWNFYNNADDMIVGKLMNAQQLGLYSLAFRLATLVNEKIGAMISRVSFPAFAAMRANPEARVQHWLSVTQKSALISFPFLATLAFIAHDLVAVVLGTKWLAAVAPLRLLCVVGTLRVLTPIAVNVLPALGRPKLAFGYTLLNAVVMPLSFFAGCRIAGINGVACAWALVFPLIAGGLLWKVLGLMKISWRAYAANLRVPVIASLAVMLPVSAFLHTLAPGPLRLSLCCCAAALAFGMILLSTAEGRALLPLRVVEFHRRGLGYLAAER